MPLFTVLIPTHDHEETLRYAAASVLEQSLGDLELLIVGDGATPRTRAVAEEIAGRDPRVRYFDFPKGPRYGERYRHELLQGEARGTLVAYQGDDDLLLPDHLETLAEALQDADFAHTMQIEVDGAGNCGGRYADLSCTGARARALRAERSLGLNTVGHRLDAYRRLPYGWRPAPPGPSDHYMWLQFFAEPWCRIRSVPWPTTLHIANAARAGRRRGERVAEIAGFAARLADPLERARLRRHAQAPLLGEAVRAASRRTEVLRVAAGDADVPSDVLLAPGARIAFDETGAGSALLLEGYSLPEHWGVWSDGGEARLLLPFAAHAPRRVRLVWKLRPFVQDEAYPRIRGALRIGQEHPIALDLTKWEADDIVTVVDRGERRLLTAVFTIENPASPASLGRGPDPRRLGIGLREIRVEA